MVSKGQMLPLEHCRDGSRSSGSGNGNGNGNGNSRSKNCNKDIQNGQTWISAPLYN